MGGESEEKGEKIETNLRYSMGARIVSVDHYFANPLGGRFRRGSC